jgi:hypothetical protein
VDAGLAGSAAGGGISQGLLLALHTAELGTHPLRRCFGLLRKRPVDTAAGDALARRTKPNDSMRGREREVRHVDMALGLVRLKGMRRNRYDFIC